MVGRAPDCPDGALPRRSLRSREGPLPVKTLTKVRVGTPVAGTPCVASLADRGGDLAVHRVRMDAVRRDLGQRLISAVSTN